MSMFYSSLCHKPNQLIVVFAIQIYAQIDIIKTQQLQNKKSHHSKCFCYNIVLLTNLSYNKNDNHKLKTSKIDHKIQMLSPDTEIGCSIHAQSVAKDCAVMKRGR